MRLSAESVIELFSKRKDTLKGLKFDLKLLEVSNMSKLKKVYKHFSKICHLQELKFTNMKEDVGLLLLFEAISNLKELKYLKLTVYQSDLSLKHEEMEKFASMFKNLRNLSKLNLRCPINNEVIKSVTSYCSNLEYLSLMGGCNGKCDDNYSELKSISNLQHLTVLKLMWLREASTKTLCSVFTNLKNLQTLRLFDLQGVYVKSSHWSFFEILSQFWGYINV